MSLSCFSITVQRPSSPLISIFLYAMGSSDLCPNLLVFSADQRGPEAAFVLATGSSAGRMLVTTPGIFFSPVSCLACFDNIFCLVSACTGAMARVT